MLCNRTAQIDIYLLTYNCVTGNDDDDNDDDDDDDNGVGGGDGDDDDDVGLCMRVTVT